MYATHSLADWAAFLSLGVGGYGALSVPYFLAVDADLVDFDPRPAVRRALESGRLVPLRQAAVYAGHDLNWAAESARHELLLAAVPVRCVAYSARELARDVAALLLLLTTSPKAGLR